MIRQYIGDMHRLYLVALVTDIPVQVHQAGKIGRDDIIGACLQGIIDFLIGHRDRDRFEFNGKAASESATGLIIFHFDQLQALYLRQQLTGFFFDLAFPQRGTGIMIGGLSLQGGARILDPQCIHQEIREFKDPFLQLLYRVVEGGIIEQGGIIVLYKARAGSARYYDRVRTRKILDELGAYLPGFIPETRVESRLATAGLIGIVFHRDTGLLQHFYHIKSRLRVELIDKTRYK
jgi:hypothetical protein